MPTYDVHNPKFGHSLGHFDATSPEEAIASAVAASGYLDTEASKDIEGTLEATEVENMVNANDPPADWHGWEVGYITIYDTHFAVGTPLEVELAERALASHCFGGLPVCCGVGPEMVTTCRVIFAA